MEMSRKRHHRKHISYDKWGLLFIIPFFVIFIWLQLIPLAKTFGYSFTKYFFSTGQGDWVGPEPIGFQNYAYLFTNGVVRDYFLFDIKIGSWFMPDILYYLCNTMIIWIMGFIPQIIVSLALAIWFTDSRLKLKLLKFWKTVMYMPNLIMAAAFGMLFGMLFSANGPVVQVLMSMGILHEEFSFQDSEFWVRFIIALINFLMWFGNTTLLLMSGVMGIDESIFESARLDGAGPMKTFTRITFPLLKPIFLYVFVTSLIGGVQLFDVAWMVTKGGGGVNMTSQTIMSYLYILITKGQNYGRAGALSVIMFIITAALSLSVFYLNNGRPNEAKSVRKEQRKRFRSYASCPDTMQEAENYRQLKGCSRKGESL